MQHHHYTILVKGKVQGVSYRFATHAQALKLGLTGLVRNLPNGDVQIEAEGPETAINQLIAWCQVGPAIGRCDRSGRHRAAPERIPQFRNSPLRKNSCKLYGPNARKTWHLKRKLTFKHNLCAGY